MVTGQKTLEPAGGAASTLAQMANAIGSTIWKLAAEVVLNAGKREFRNHDPGQRVDLLEELACVPGALLRSLDCTVGPTRRTARRIYRLPGDRDMARLLEDSRIDVQGTRRLSRGICRQAEPSARPITPDSVSAKRKVAVSRCAAGSANVSRLTMGERDNRWIPDYIVGREAPQPSRKRACSAP